MNRIVHASATADHYNQESATYDIFNEKNSIVINECLKQIFKKNNVKTVLDLTCGTGSQVFYLSQQGFEIQGYDINAQMIKIAKKKALEKDNALKFSLGDMRTVRTVEYDAVITIFNAIGHLTKPDFQKTIQNIYLNLIRGGLYVFDIFNLSYLLHADNITKLTIDGLKKYDDMTVREIQYSTINNEGVLASYDIYHQQRGDDAPVISHAFQTLQVYNSLTLKQMLEENGFEVVNQCDIDGGPFDETKTERILSIAKKI
jgi:2-polyprenyl-3-methyl-5-hydroxy-6-metoxy-1,4-benzoquinol methylase